jgi:hypothetical protein
MRLTLSAHGNDYLYLSWGDIFWLAFGWELQTSSLCVRRDPWPETWHEDQGRRVLFFPRVGKCTPTVVPQQQDIDVEQKLWEPEEPAGGTA